MFQFLKKNNQRTSYMPQYPSPYPYQYPQNMPQPYDNNMMDMEVNELKRKINDLSQRINRLESFLGIRDDDSFSNYS